MMRMAQQIKQIKILEKLVVKIKKRRQDIRETINKQWMRAGIAGFVSISLGA